MTNPCPYDTCPLTVPVSPDACRECLCERLGDNLSAEQRVAMTISLLLTGEV
jgi:hypothetical protein